MKTTKKQFELFKSECLKWIKEFELSGWRFDFYLEELTEAQASVTRDYDGCVVTVRLDKEIKIDDDGDYNQVIIESAKHEMIHAMLGNLSALAVSRYIQRDEIYKAEEELVRKLEKII